MYSVLWGQYLRRLVPDYAVVFRLGRVHLPGSLSHRHSRRRLLFLCGSRQYSMCFNCCTDLSPFLTLFDPPPEVKSDICVKCSNFIRWNVCVSVFKKSCINLHGLLVQPRRGPEKERKKTSSHRSLKSHPPKNWKDIEPAERPKKSKRTKYIPC